MRCDAEAFGEDELELVHLSRRLSDARRVETLLDAEGFEYLLEVADYQATLMFLVPVTRQGVYFHVRSERAASARRLLAGRGFQVVELLDERPREDATGPAGPPPPA